MCQRWPPLFFNGGGRVLPAGIRKPWKYMQVWPNDRKTKVWTFISDAAKAAWERMMRFINGVVKHTEAIAILTLSAVGLNVLLSELPFYIATPMWVEATMVLPVVSVLIIGGLVKLAEIRH